MARATPRLSGRVSSRAADATAASKTRWPGSGVRCGVERSLLWVIEMAASNVAVPSRFGFAAAGESLLAAARRYLPGILVELALVVVILAAFQVSGYGRQPGRLNNIGLGLTYCVLAWGAGEARFRL